jgi:hypothetical protein
MITRIPQPQFIGPSPAEVVDQAENTGTRWAQIVQQGIDEGQKNYLANKEINQKAEETKSSFDQLKLQMKFKDIESAFAQAGPGNEAKVFVEQGDKIKSLASDLYGPAGDHIFEAWSQGVLNSTKPGTLFNLGALGIGNAQAQRQQQPAPQTQALPVSAAPGVSATPSAQPAATPPPAAAITLAHPLPETPAEVSQLAPTLAQNNDLMKDFRTYLTSQGKKVSAAGNPTSNATLLQNNMNSFQKYLGSLDDNKKLALVNGAGGQAAGQNASGTVQAQAFAAVSKGIPAAALAAAAPAFQKLQNAAADAADLTPKDKAALNVVVNPVVKVLQDSPVVKQLIKLGMSQETLNNARDKLQDAINTNPDFAEALKTGTLFAGKDAKDVLDNMNQQRLAEKTASDMGISEDKQHTANIALALKTVQVPLQLQMALERLNAQAKTSNNANARMGMLLAQDAYNKAIQVQSDWIDKHVPKGANPADIDKLVSQEMKNQSGALYQSQALASKLLAPILNEDPQTMMQELGASYYVSMFGINLGEKSPAATVPTPVFTPPVGAAGKPAAAPSAPAAPNPAGAAGNSKANSLIDKYSQ